MIIDPVIYKKISYMSYHVHLFAKKINFDDFYGNGYA